ncbi:MAG: hypothetical protein U1F58_11435 [Burkholderiales bacterium]
MPFHVLTTPDGSRWTEFHRVEGGYVLRFPDLADFAVSANGFDIVAFPAPGVADSTAQHLYVNQVLPLAQSKQGRPVFHGSAVEVDGEAIAFIAGSGCGKSTLAATFARSGCRFLTDDGLMVAPAEHNWLVEPGHPSIRLWTDSEQALLGSGMPRAPALPFTAKARFVAGERLPFCNEPRPLHRAYFLGNGETPDIVIRSLTARNAMMAWVRHSFLLDVDEQLPLTRHFEQVARLACEPIHFELDYPRRFDELDRVLRAIFHHAGTSGSVA